MTPTEQSPGETIDTGEAYHIELRQFPYNTCRFNLTERELRATVVEPWAREQWIELGDRKWSPHQAKLTVLAGPRLPVEELSMGRGWRAAERRGRDVTTQVLAVAKEGVGGEAQALPKPGGETLSARPGGDLTPSQTESLMADSLGLELLAVLGSGRAPLRRAWDLAGERHSECSPGESLTLAEGAVASLLRTGLIVLVRGEGADEVERQLGDTKEIQTVLRAIDSWTRNTSGGGDATAPVWIRRA